MSQQPPGYDPNAVGATQKQQGKGGALFGLFQDTNGWMPDTQGWGAGMIGASFATSKPTGADTFFQALGFRGFEAHVGTDVTSIAEGVQAGSHQDVYGTASATSSDSSGGDGGSAAARMLYGSVVGAGATLLAHEIQYLGQVWMGNLGSLNAPSIGKGMSKGKGAAIGM